MSVLIKGMEMPKNCAVCQLERDIFGRAVCFGYEDGRALYNDDLPPAGTEIRRPSWCPLIALPLHGRLIDADALESHIFNKWLEDEISNKEWLLIRKLIQEPTIVGANTKEKSLETGENFPEKVEEDVNE